MVECERFAARGLKQTACFCEAERQHSSGEQNLGVRNLNYEALTDPAEQTTSGLTPAV
jgi:hypothetical protein